MKAKGAIVTYFRFFCHAAATCFLVQEAFSTCRSTGRSHTPTWTTWDSAWLARPDSINDKLSKMVTRWKIEFPWAHTAGTSLREDAETHETAMRDVHRVKFLGAYSICWKYVERDRSCSCFLLPWNFRSFESHTFSFDDVTHYCRSSI